MVRVADAEQIILQEARDFGSESLPFMQSGGRVLAAPLLADRDFPPFHRVTMDGIAIVQAAWAQGIRSFRIKATEAAGDLPTAPGSPDECIEIMTGAALPYPADAVVPYEELQLHDGRATVLSANVRRGQNIHEQGKDKKQGELLVPAGTRVDAAVTGLAAATGNTMLRVKKLPRIAVLSTGDELVAPGQTPAPAQIRRSNDHTIAAVLQAHGLQAELMPVRDEPGLLRNALQHAIEHFDAVLLSGGVSQGKFDHVPAVLEALSVARLFHRVQQKPGKPFWFGRHPAGAKVFAFPGNPVSTFLCLHRYFLPWLRASLGLDETVYAACLTETVRFDAALHYFLQVRVTVSNTGQLLAAPAAGNGSGDFVNLAASNAFMELPAEENTFKEGTAWRIWPFKNIWDQ